MTHPLVLISDLGSPALNSAFVIDGPKMPGEPMRVQPSRAKKPAGDDA